MTGLPCQKEPFFLYLATNAPHGPYRVDPEWSEPYRDSVLWGNGANFYGMITNIDHNLGLLREHLEDLDLAEKVGSGQYGDHKVQCRL